MADNVHTITVRSYSTGTQGRAIANSRNHHWVIDDGVPGEEIGAAEAFPIGHFRLRGEPDKSGGQRDGRTVVVGGCGHRSRPGQRRRPPFTRT